MKKIILFLLMMILCGPVFATTFYVSNAATNGYAIGNDSNSGLSPSSPFLTFTHAVVATPIANSIVMCNPTGIPYNEDGAGTSGLHIPGQNNGGNTIETDPTLLGVGKCVIQATASDRVINIATTAGTLVINNIIVDGLNHNTSGWEPNNETGSLSGTGDEFQNFKGGQFAISGFSGTGNVFSLDKANFRNTVVSGIFSAGSFTSYNITGSTFSTTTSSFPSFVADGGTITSMHIGPSSDGTRNTFNGSGTIMDIRTGTITKLEIDHSDLGGSLVIGFFGNNLFPATVTTGLFHDNTITGSSWTHPAFEMRNITSSDTEVYKNTLTGGTGGICTLNSELITKSLVNNNTAVTGASVNQDPITIGMGSGIIDVSFNNITDNSTLETHGILIGADGFVQDSSNITGTTTQNLGDVSGNTYVNQTFTTSPLTQNGRSSYIGNVDVVMKSSGTPVGNITASIYTDSGGNPNTLVETSETAVNANLLTSSFQSFIFPFTAHHQYTAATKYDIVLNYTGSVDGTNYVILSTNTTVTNGYLSKSTTGPGGSWVADSSHAALYNIYTGIYNTTTLVAHDNYLLNAIGAFNQNHGLLIGSAKNASMYRNVVLNWGPGLIYKEATNSSMYDNLGATNIGTQGVFADKGATVINIYNNTCTINGAITANCIYTVNDSAEASGNPPTSTVTAKNNILVANGGYLYYNDPGTTNTVDYNSDYISGTGHANSTYLTWATWQGQGNDPHSVLADPLLTNETNPLASTDFIPSSISPAKGIGINSNGLVPNDYLGNPFPVIPDAGAYSISAYYNLGLATKWLYGPLLDSDLYQIGLTKSASDIFYQPLVNQTNISASAALPTALGNYIANVDATSGTVTVTLPTAVGVGGYTATVTKIDSSANQVIIATSNTQNINGASTLPINSQYGSYTVISNGSNWLVVTNNNQIFNNGNVGIGSSNPGQALDIAGTLKIRDIGIGTTVPQELCRKSDGTFGYFNGAWSSTCN